MDTLKGIMIKYANERGGGLPLTPEEICNCVVLWAQQYAPTAITINGGEGVSINNELVDDNKKVITININPASIGGGGGGAGLFVHTYSYDNVPKFKILTPISTNISPVGWNDVGLFTDPQKILCGAVYMTRRGSTTPKWWKAFNFTDDKGLTFTRIGYNESYVPTFSTDSFTDTQDLSEYVETIEPFTGGNM